jgi:hypothetical protein
MKPRSSFCIGAFGACDNERELWKYYSRSYFRRIRSHRFTVRISLLHTVTELLAESSRSLTSNERRGIYELRGCESSTGRGAASFLCNYPKPRGIGDLQHVSSAVTSPAMGNVGYFYMQFRCVTEEIQF